MERNERQELVRIFQQHAFAWKMVFQGNSDVSWKFFGVLLRTYTKRQAAVLKKPVCHAALDLTWYRTV